MFADLTADRFGSNLSTLIQQPHIPRSRTVLLRRKYGDNQSLQRAGGQLDRHLPELSLAILSGGQFQDPIETGPIVEHFEHDREKPALGENAIVTYKDIEADVALDRAPHRKGPEDPKPQHATAKKLGATPQQAPPSDRGH